MDTLMGTLKILAEKRLEITMMKARNEPEYQDEIKKVIDLESKYESISMELKPEIKSIVNDLLATRDGINMEQMELSYLSGMNDCIMILRELELLQL